MAGLPFQLPSGLPTGITFDELDDYVGTSNGVATVSGALAVNELDGTLTGVGSTIGSLIVEASLFGVIGGTSTTAGALTQTNKLAATSTGTSTTFGNLSVEVIEVWGGIAGIATVVGAIQNPGPEIFDTPGDSFTFVVPEYVYLIETKVWGAGAGGGGGAAVATGGDGGGGGFAASILAVTPGETLDVFVGGGGGGGFGDGTVWDGRDGGGGGGYSGIKRSSLNLLISGSGGGGGGGQVFASGQNGGAGGGDVGVDGSGSGGSGGSQTNGGTGGGSGALDGSLLQGGDGASSGIHTTPGGINGGGLGGHGWPFATRIGAGGGGGAGRYGGGGGGQRGGGGGGSNHVTGTVLTNERGSSWVGAGKIDSDYPGGNYGNGGIGVYEASGGAGEGGYIHLSWQMNIPGKLQANIIPGSSSVQGTLDPLNSGVMPVPIPVDLLVQAGSIHGLDTVAAGQAAVVGVLRLFHDAMADSNGVATVTGSLTNTDMELTGILDGIATVSGVLQNGSGGVYPIELAGQSDGVATVGIVHSVLTGSPLEQKRYLYQYVSTGVAFDPTDTYNGPASVVSYGYPDGDVQADFRRFLMQLVNVGAAFDDTDDVLTRTVGSINPKVTAVISQPFPDGDIMRDWSRNLYQFLQVVDEEIETGRLTIGPTPMRDTWRPLTKPPVSAVRTTGPKAVGPRTPTATTSTSVRRNRIRFI